MQKGKADTSKGEPFQVEREETLLETVWGKDCQYGRKR